MLQLEDTNKVCLFGQMVLGEIVACPSAARLQQVNICLLDCGDVVRVARLQKRGTYGVNQDTLNWAAWLRMHHYDPQWQQHVIKEDSSPIMQFGRWDALDSWNKLAAVEVIDATSLSIEQVANSVANWLKRSMNSKKAIKN